ncbi:MAG TPA: HprK-related kinase A [Rhodocyclaceae bacterium]|nr:HprK-related kinase A [Rhodocyclaceae bacterium]
MTSVATSALSSSSGTLGDLSLAALARQLSGPGLMLRSGPLTFSIRSPLPDVAHTLHLLYADHPQRAYQGYADFYVGVDRASNLRGWIKPQAQFDFDDSLPFKPLPRVQAFAMLEWGLNWVIASTCHQYLVIHAAVIERNGLAAILPAPPGSGKSTLCAGLIHRGWRLCSDELTLLTPGSGEVVALARPVNLKNNSIGIIQKFAPESIFGPVVPDTLKGQVAHLRPPRESVLRVNETAVPRWIIFPRWQADSAPVLQAGSKSHAFIDLASNAFNYNVLGESGFETLAGVIDRCECLSFTYSNLDDAVGIFDRLAEEAGA